MSKADDVSINYVSANDSSSRGLVIEIESSTDSQLASSDVQTRIRFSNRWHTKTRVTLNDARLDLVVVGHLYARSSDGFDISNALQLLGRIYRENNIEAVRAAIGGGMFALFLIDYDKRQIHAMCDLFACMPLFYSTTSTSVSLATNQFDLSPGHRLSRNACLEYISIGYLPFSASIYEGVDRLGPGQVITVNLSTGTIERLTDERMPPYPALNDRIHDSLTACQKLDCVLTGFFSRLNGKSIAAGLSGGYDSRLIAAFTQRNKPHFVTFNYPGTREVEIAQNIAHLLHNRTRVLEIPPDAPFRFIEDFRLGMQTLDDLEASHVFALLDALLTSEPDYIVDGYLGDTIVGGYYYYKLSGGIEPITRVLSLRDKYEEKLRTVDEYIDICLNGFGRTIDLERVTGEKLGNFINRNTLESLISLHLKYCYSHADMIEILKYRIRGRGMIACGPVTFLRRKSTLCPYYDTDVLTTCMSIDKRLRAGDRIYNAFWRYRFPELADVRKESTGGRASQSDIAYRLTHFRGAFRRRILQALPSITASGSKAGGNIDDFFTRYYHCRTNREYFDRMLEDLRPFLHEIGLNRYFPWTDNTKPLGPLYFRLASLAALVCDTKSSL